MKDNEIILKYTGDSVADGSIEVGDLICGLSGMAKLWRIILDRHYHPLNKYVPDGALGVSLRVQGFKKGSFEAVLCFTETYPAFTNAFAVIAGAVIGALAYYFKNDKTPEIDNPEAERVFHSIIRNSGEAKRAQKALGQIYIALNDKGIESVTIQSAQGDHIIADTNSLPVFAANDAAVDFPQIADASLRCASHGIAEEIIELSIEGSFRSLNKTTLNGKFAATDGHVYSVSLAMKNPEEYFKFYDKKQVTIQGIAVYDKIRGKISRINVRHIRE